MPINYEAEDEWLSAAATPDEEWEPTEEEWDEYEQREYDKQHRAYPDRYMAWQEYYSFPVMLGRMGWEVTCYKEGNKYMRKERAKAMSAVEAHITRGHNAKRTARVSTPKECPF